MKLRYIVLMMLAMPLCACTGGGSGTHAVITPLPATEQATETHNATETAITPSMPIATATPTPTPVPPSKAEQLLETMTLHEKIGQLFIVQPEALHAGMLTGVQDGEALAQAMKDYPVGGVVLFAKNIETPEQLTDFIGGMKGQSDIPLFVSVDEEGGQVARVADSPAFDVQKYNSMREIGDTGDSTQAYEAGLAIGTYLKEYGFNLDFAPVADVLTNPSNKAIGNRAFSGDPQVVADMVAAEVEGLQQAGMMSCIKHYPGHGHTSADTHDGTVSIDKSWEQLLECELIPFINALDDTDMVMVSHITAPNIDGSGLPASLSRDMMQGRLRGELGYGGVIITDSFSMGAITENYTPAESAVAAVLAGADIVLMPYDLAQAFDGIAQALQDGTLTEQRLDESVLHILSLKEEYGLLD